MKTWGEVKTAIEGKLYITSSDEAPEEYVNQYETLANEALSIIANGVKPMVKYYEIDVFDTKETLNENEFLVNSVVKMPDDFLSFIGIKILKDSKPCTTCAYYAVDGLLVTEKGHYIIPYYAMYPEILTANNQPEGYNNQDLGIPRAVLDCVPNYVASKCLQEDDLQRSTVLANDFEMLLSRLDAGEMHDIEHYESEGGWY